MFIGPEGGKVLVKSKFIFGTDVFVSVVRTFGGVKDVLEIDLNVSWDAATDASDAVG